METKTNQVSAHGISDELSNLRGISQILWIMSGFKHTDLGDVSDALNMLSNVLDQTAENIEEFLDQS